MSTQGKTIWIDLDNTPHVPFFKPIIRELTLRGYNIRVTARDAYQVCDLARHMGIPHETIGRHQGKRRLLKVFGAIGRAIHLVPFALREKPDLALSHGSRPLELAAKLLRIPSVKITDYEYTKPLPLFMSSSWKIVPELIPPRSRKFPLNRCFTYSGIKEDVYVSTFEPDPAFLGQLGMSDDAIIATVRPPATEAHYHDLKGDRLFEAVMDFLTGESNLRVILLPRNERQTA